MLELSRADVTDVARKVVGNERADMLEWQVELLGGGLGSATRGVYKVSGKACDNDGEVEWSAVLKVLSLIGAGGQSGFDEELHPIYWKREALAYRSDLLDSLPGGIRAPRCYGVIEKSPGVIWIWLEEVRNGYRPGWALEQYERAAICLGRFNGAYLAGHRVPEYSWLVQNSSPRGLLDYTSWIRDVIADSDTWTHPLVAALFPAGIAERLLRLWDGRSTLLDRLERVEQTFCHLDAWRMNMVTTKQDIKAGGITMLDWAVPGSGAIGTDAGDLFGESFGLEELDGVEPGELDLAIFESYVDGLRAAGWSGDPLVVRFAYTAFCALKHTFSVGLFWLRDVEDEGGQARWKHIFGRPFADLARREARLVCYLLDLADEARSLADLLPGLTVHH